MRQPNVSVYGSRSCPDTVRASEYLESQGVPYEFKDVDLDFRGTLAISKEVPIGFKAVRLRFDIDSDATEEQLATLMKLTERYCVIYQSLKNPPALSVTTD